MHLATTGVHSPTCHPRQLQAGRRITRDRRQQQQQQQALPASGRLLRPPLAGLRPLQPRKAIRPVRDPKPLLPSQSKKSLLIIYVDKVYSGRKFC